MDPGLTRAGIDPDGKVAVAIRGQYRVALPAGRLDGGSRCYFEVGVCGDGKEEGNREDAQETVH
jgi:hypothetical protein